jgi:hypothetical protein
MTESSGNSFDLIVPALHFLAAKLLTLIVILFGLDKLLVGVNKELFIIPRIDFNQIEGDAHF